MAGAGSTLIGLKGKKYQLQSEKAKGGEGTVFVTGDPSVVVKVYHRPDAWTERKLKCMVHHPLNPYADGVHLLDVYKRQAQGYTLSKWSLCGLYNASYRGGKAYIYVISR